jgi:ribosomal protein S18 acetylase RimI-like enzyme
VASAQRKQGVGARLVRMFEARAPERGCRTFCLTTFSFQAPRLYPALGYRVAHELRGFSDGIVRYDMVRELDSENA